MNLDAVMKELRAKGKANTVKIYKRHGVREESYGVSYADLGAVVKKLKVDHALALALWDTGVHDARVLATKIASPELMSAKDIARWLEASSNYVINDALSALAAQMADAPGLAEAWIQKDDEWISAAGWNIYATLALNGTLSVSVGRKLIRRIRTGIANAKNRARHSMNSALIAIGGSMEALREDALAAARAIGKVEVDHGQTGCKTPDAIPYIERMVARGAKRTRTTGARTRASGKSATAAGKQTAGQKTAGKQTTGKKPGKKPAGQKPAGKKPGKKPAGQKTAGQKTAGKQTTGKKPGKKTAGKQPGKKPAGKKPAGKKTAGKKTAGKQTAAVNPGRSAR